MTQALLTNCRIHVGITKPPTRDAWSFSCFTTASINASFFGVHPSEGQKYTVPHTSSDIHHARTILTSFPGIYMTAPSSLSTTAPKSPSPATKTSPDVCLQSLLLAFSWVILAASVAKPPDLLHLFVELLLDLLLSHLVVNSKGNIECALVPFHVLFFCTPRPAIQQGTSRFFLTFFEFISCSSFSPVLGSFPCLFFLITSLLQFPAPIGHPSFSFHVLNMFQSRTRHSKLSYHQENQQRPLLHFPQTPSIPFVFSPFVPFLLLRPLFSSSV